MARVAWRSWQLQASLLAQPQLVQGPPGWWRAIETVSVAPKLLLVHPRHQGPLQVQEALQLAEAQAGEQCTAFAAGAARSFVRHPATYFGSGAVDEVKTLCSLREFQKVFVNAELSGVQLRNLESEWGRPVLDRVGLIIEIFAQRARTREARLQVEMALLQYKASRLVRAVDTRTGLRRGFGADGQTEVVSARERGRSGASSGGLGGASGGGETELQLQRRRIGSRIKALKCKLDEVRRTREVQRLGRQRAGKPVLGVVGYTSAGKSTLLSALTHKPVVARERLFETLDPLLRRVYLPSGREALASDTVGFISDLPHSLISAFQATLEEVAEADLLLHVLDVSSPNVAAQRATVYKVLRQLQVPESRLQHNLIEVWNKSDLLKEEAVQEGLRHIGSLISSTGSASQGVAAQRLASNATSWTDSEIDPSGRQELNEEERGPVDALEAARLFSEPQEGKHSQSRLELSVSMAEAESSLEGAKLDERARNAEEDTKCNPRLEQHTAILEQPDLVSKISISRSSTADKQMDGAWRLIQAIRRQQGGLQPRAIVTSAATREGLSDLLSEIDRKVSVRCAIEELKFGCARSGPRALNENVVGPALRKPELRRAPRYRLPVAQPLSQENAKRMALWQD